MHSLTCVVLFSLCIPTPLPSFSSCTHECWEWWGKSGTGHIWIGLWSRPRQWVAHDAESYLRFVQSSIYFSIQSKVTYNQESVSSLCAAICRLYHAGLTVAILAITKVWWLANIQPLGLTALIIYQTVEFKFEFRMLWRFSNVDEYSLILDPF